MFLVVDITRLNDVDILLEELDFQYCLPKAFWLDVEWSRYMYKRLQYVKQIQENLRLDKLYFDSLEFCKDEEL